MSTAEQEILGEMSTEALMAEVTRRIECAKKPERRTIFIGPRQTTSTQQQRQRRSDAASTHIQMRSCIGSHRCVPLGTVPLEGCRGVV